MAEQNGNGPKANGQDQVVTAIHELTAVVRELQVGQREGNTRLEAVEQVLRGHGRQLEGIHGQIKGIHGQLEGIHGQIEGIHGQIDGIHGQIDGIHGQIDGIHGRLGKLEEGLSDLRGEVRDGFADLGGKIDSAGERDRHLEEHLERLDDRLTRMEAREAEGRQG